MTKKDLEFLTGIFNVPLNQLFKDVLVPIETQTYPKYDIIKLDDYNIRLDFALAGKSKDEISVDINDGYLMVSASKVDVDNVEYIHKGISSRQFEIKFKLLDTHVVKDATFENGILSIYVENVIPEEKKPRKIEIISKSTNLLDNK